jgi:glycosyltransferase involved in cell wall biosynthesis
LLVIAFHYPPDNTSTGVRRTFKFTEYLLRHRWQSHVISVPEHLYASRNPPEAVAIPDEIVVERTWACDIKRALGVRGLYPGWLAVPDRYWPWYFAGVRAGTSAIRRRRLDALYSTFPQPTAHLIALRLKKRFGLPWIADFRDPWVEGSMPRWRRWLEGKMEGAVIRAADRVICNTPAMRRDFVERYPTVDSARFVTITNGYDEADFAQLVPERIAKFQILHPGEINIVHRDPAGLLRGVRCALDHGWLDQNDLQLTFLGAGSYGDSPRFRQELADLGLQHAVEIVVPRVPYQHALARTAGADVVVLLSENLDGARGEGVRSYTRLCVPAKLYEYLRLGRPILALVSEGSVKELLEQTRTGDPIPPMDIERIARALARYYAERSATPRGVQPAGAAVAVFNREHLTRVLARQLDGLVAEYNTAQH